jgi:hypothetical protein
VKSQPVEFLESIEDDLVYAYDYYDSWHPEGRDYFRGQWFEAVSWIEWNPELFPKRHRFFRRAMIRNTYFAAIFAIEPTVTTVVAVLDMRQDPKEIRRILKARRSRG